MASNDKTKDLLEQLLADIYSKQVTTPKKNNGSYLIAQDNQFLGRINSNAYDQEAILNKYSPYGSKYSATSIFNNYSPYGSNYGGYSAYNTNCMVPPKLFIDGKFKGHISNNPRVQNRIPTEVFVYMLNNHIPELLAGNICYSDNDLRKLRKESFILAQDNTFLGSLDLGIFNNNDSIFNKFGFSYGSKFSQISIFNAYSPYGSKFSLLSAYNEFAQTPPELYLEGNRVGYVTKNKFIQNGVDPDDLEEWAKKYVKKNTFW